VERNVGSRTLGDGFSLGRLDGDVGARDFGVADGQTTLRAERDVAENDSDNGSFGQADDRTGGSAIGGCHVLEGDVVEVGGEAGDRRWGHVSGGENLRVVLADDDGVLDLLHVDVAEGDGADIGAAVAVGFDAKAVIGAVEVNACRNVQSVMVMSRLGASGPGEPAAPDLMAMSSSPTSAKTWLMVMLEEEKGSIASVLGECWGARTLMLRMVMSSE
jgi:hypothetical protein